MFKLNRWSWKVEISLWTQTVTEGAGLQLLAPLATAADSCFCGWLFPVFLLGEKMMHQAAWTSLACGGYISPVITRQLPMDLLCFSRLPLLASSLVSEAHALMLVRDFGKSCSSDPGDPLGTTCIAVPPHDIKMGHWRQLPASFPTPGLSSVAPVAAILLPWETTLQLSFTGTSSSQVILMHRSCLTAWPWTWVAGQSNSCLYLGIVPLWVEGCTGAATCWHFCGR